MSLRALGGFIRPGYNPLRVPNAPTIGTASQASSTSVSVPFTAPSCVGGSAITGYTAVSSPGCKVGTASSSPITVGCLTTGTAYTFRVFATNSYGPSATSAASNSVTPAVVGQQAYTTAGTYSWVAPTGVTSVSVVAVGGGSTSGGGLGYKNNISVTPGNSYTVVVSAGVQYYYTAGNSYFNNTSTVAGIGGGSVGAGGGYVGDGGGAGGYGGYFAGGGAGGYAGPTSSTSGGPGSAGLSSGAVGYNGTGGGGGGGSWGSGPYGGSGGGGGGVGILGQGSNGVGGSQPSARAATGGSGGGSATTWTCFGAASTGGAYGGGGGFICFCNPCFGGNTSYGVGGRGAVRIIWPGTSRQFPSTNTGDL